MRNTAEHPVDIEGENAFYWGGPFSNFTFVPDGLPYTDRLLGAVMVPTVEHAFQSFKTLDPAERRAILSVKLPKQALYAGRRCTLRADWEKIKVDAMIFLCRRRLEVDFELAYLFDSLIDRGLKGRERSPSWGERTGYVWSVLAAERRA